MKGKQQKEAEKLKKENQKRNKEKQTIKHMERERKIKMYDKK